MSEGHEILFSVFHGFFKSQFASYCLIFLIVNFLYTINWIIPTLIWYRCLLLVAITDSTCISVLLPGAAVLSSFPFFLQSWLKRKVFVRESLKVTSRNVFCNTAAYHYWCHFIFHWSSNWIKTACQIGCSVHVCVSYVIKIKLVEMYVSLACILLIDTELPLKVYFMCICACMFQLSLQCHIFLGTRL